ncbi:MAG: response regulator [Myxococcales bacterium]
MTQQPRVLVVEDDETIRETVVEFLDEEGYPAVGAVHGRDGLAKLAALNPLPRLILLDLMMPVMDGRSFREQQLREPTLAAIPVIVLSALVDSSNQASQMNVAGHLKKPFSLADLMALVREHCGAPRVA